MVGKPKLVDDPNTFIPPAVRKQAEAADAAFRAARGDPPKEEAPPEQTTPPVTPEVTPPEKTVEPTPPAFPTPPSQQPSPQTTPPPPAPVEEESWERRYKSMEGRYKRAENDILGMSAQITSMQSLIASMQQPVTPSTPAELRPESLLTPEEISEYGQDFLDVVARRAKEAQSPEVTALRSKLTTLENQLKNTSEQQQNKARLDMEMEMTRALPHWRDINVMPEFHQWLALPDMYSGAIKHDLLRTAYAQNNSPRVLSFFKGFLDQEAALVPQGQQPQPAEPNGKLSLEDFAAPGRAKTSAASVAPVEKPIITRAQISAFYADSAAGRYRGREAEKNQLEAMIFDAEREGRIR